MLTIGNIVSLDTQAEFRNDVQLDSYQDPAMNLALLRSYLFASTAPDRDVAGARSISSVGLLDQIIETFLNSRIENRMVAVANYGHGKSHLALALINYFAKSFDSEEVQTLLGKLDTAVVDPAKASRYRDFKRSRGEFLVVRLRGDLPRSLREQFMIGLEKALSEHPATANLKPGFWFTVAEKFLRNLSPVQMERANAYLEQYATDAPQLLYQVQQRREVYDECMGLFTYMYGVPPDFGGEVSLKNAVNWVVTATCGEGKPLSGVLVLFDEFSLYVQKYGQRGGVGELQDLLNGISDQQGKAVFLAFAQHDPITVADNLIASGQVRESLRHELDRLPRKFALYSLMESVIAAYLKQSDRNWAALNQEPGVRGWVNQASDVTLTAFGDRYDRTLRWTPEKFQETVTKGCFPLHPLTTYLLCNLNYGAAAEIGTPRTVLGFVMERIQERSSFPAFVDGRVNWVLPMELVDYFEPRLHGDAYTSYEGAARLIDPDAPREHRDVLKGLFLHELAKVGMRGDEQLWFIGHCAGLKYDQTKQILKTLADSKAIRYDSSRKVNLFWPSTSNPDKLQEILRKKLDEQRFDEKALGELESVIRKLPGALLNGASISVAWGEQSDWKADETILTPDKLAMDDLGELLRNYSSNSFGIEEGQRGLVVWLLARDENEIHWCRNELPKEVDKAYYGDAPIPVVFVIPPHPATDLISSFMRLRALKGLTQSERDEAGQQIYENEIKEAAGEVYVAAIRLIGEGKNYADLPRDAGEYIVPMAYRAHARVLPRPSVRTVLTECYRLAYRYAPPEFFTQYKLSNAKQRNAVKLVSNLLLENSADALRRSIRSDPVARDLCEKILRQKWQILASDLRIRVPDSQTIARAWTLLDESFPSGGEETPVRGPLVSLLNPPYGYDYNTATLLFCSWFGYYSHDIQVSVLGRVVSRDTLAQALQSGPKDFFVDICTSRSVALTRRDPSQASNDVQRILESIVTGTFTQDQATEAITVLNDFAENGRNPADLRERAVAAATELRSSFEIAQDYDRQVAALERSFDKADLKTLVSTLNRIEKLPRSGLVLPAAAKPAEIRQSVLAHIGEVVERDSRQSEALERVTQLENNLSQLRTRREIVQDAGLIEYTERIDQAIRVVNDRAEKLQAREREEAIRVEIQSLDVTSPLARLYESRTRLQTLSGYSDETMTLGAKRLQAIEMEISSLEEGADSWIPSLDRCTSLRELDRNRDQMVRVSNRYSGTEFEALLDSALDRADHLKDFFREFGAIRDNLKLIRTSSPAAIEKMTQQLEDLVERFASSLSDVQRSVVSEFRRQINQAVADQSREAVVWLDRLEREFRNSAEPVKLSRSLDKVPDFLPDGERFRLEELRTRVQLRIDEDMIAKIEQLFRNISDIDRRRLCLQRLTGIMESK